MNKNKFIGILFSILALIFSILNILLALDPRIFGLFQNANIQNPLDQISLILNSVTKAIQYLIIFTSLSLGFIALAVLTIVKREF